MDGQKALFFSAHERSRLKVFSRGAVLVLVVVVVAVVVSGGGGVIVFVLVWVFALFEWWCGCREGYCLMTGYWSADASVCVDAGGW